MRYRLWITALFWHTNGCCSKNTCHALFDHSIHLFLIIIFKYFVLLPQAFLFMQMAHVSKTKASNKFFLKKFILSCFLSVFFSYFKSHFISFILIQMGNVVKLNIWFWGQFYFKKFSWLFHEWFMKFFDNLRVNRHFIVLIQMVLVSKTGSIFLEYIFFFEFLNHGFWFLFGHFRGIENL